MAFGMDFGFVEPSAIIAILFFNELMVELGAGARARSKLFEYLLKQLPIGPMVVAMAGLDVVAVAETEFAVKPMVELMTAPIVEPMAVLIPIPISSTQEQPP